ncbi:MAG: phosphodiester glycosidase family protein [Flavobacteriales bacterium]
MKRKIIFISILALITLFAFKQSPDEENSNILSYEVDLKTQDLKLYWKDEKGKQFRSFESLKSWLLNKNKELVFAANGGMYMKNRSPLGLYIENREQITKLNTRKNAKGNFYLKPNGVFYLKDDNTGGVCVTDKFDSTRVNYATQSGPMLLIDGEYHPAFNEGSSNLNLRNGVGVLPNGKVLFAMSKTRINFYDFATYFKTKGCKNALYLDGYVSRTYLPEKNWKKGDGNFGVIIGVTEKN